MKNSNDMLFYLNTSKYFYPDQYERDRLETLGFNFRTDSSGRYVINNLPQIEFKTLEELVAFGERWGAMIIEDGGIELYNGHRE